MVVTSEELTTKLVEEATPLLGELHQEVGEFPELPLEINWGVYWGAQVDDNLMIVTAREEGKLMGYLVFLMTQHPHYGGTIFAIQDVLYLKPELRGKMTGIRMFKHAEHLLKERGVVVMIAHTRTVMDFSPMLIRLGYNESEISYTKRIE